MAQKEARLAHLEADPEIRAYQQLSREIRSAHTWNERGQKLAGFGGIVLLPSLLVAPFLADKLLTCLVPLPGLALLGAGIWMTCHSGTKLDEVRRRSDNSYSDNHGKLQEKSHLERQLKFDRAALEAARARSA